MRTIFYSLTILLITSVSLKAQQLSAGPIMGLNYNSIYFNQNFTLDDEQYLFRTEEGGVGLQAGAFIRARHQQFFTELQFSFAQERSNVSLTGDQVSRLQQVNMNRIYLPLKIGYAIDEKFNVFAGARITKFVDASMMPSNSMLYAHFDESLTPVSAGYFFGLGVMVSQFKLNLSYGGGFKPNSIQAEFQNNLLKLDHSEHLFQFTLTYDLHIMDIGKWKDKFFAPEEELVVME